MAIPSGSQRPPLEAVLASPELVWGDVQTKADGPAGALPLTDEMLRHWPSGDLFSLSQNAGMGWEAHAVAREPFLILSTQGGFRAPDGTPIALGYHTGHWEIGLLVQEAAEELKRQAVVPFAGMVSDPCDGRTQGTAGMMDSLPYRNDAAIVLRRLIRSLPRRKGVLGIATCDKGLPAMAMSVAGSLELASVLVPGDVLVLMGRGPMGAGMEEIYQITASLRHLSFGKQVAVLTDARFSGVSTGACIGHISPEALAGGPLGKVRDGDLIRIEVDRLNHRGSLDLVGAEGREFGSAEGSRVLAGRGAHPQLSPDPELPDDTRLWAALQAVAGGTWGGCVYDTNRSSRRCGIARENTVKAGPATPCAGGTASSRPSA